MKSDIDYLEMTIFRALVVGISAGVQKVSKKRQISVNLFAASWIIGSRSNDDLTETQDEKEVRPTP